MALNLPFSQISLQSIFEATGFPLADWNSFDYYKTCLRPLMIWNAWPNQNGATGYQTAQALYVDFPASEVSNASRWRIYHLVPDIGPLYLLHRLEFGSLFQI